MADARRPTAHTVLVVPPGTSLLALGMAHHAAAAAAVGMTLVCASAFQNHLVGFLVWLFVAGPVARATAMFVALKPFLASAAFAALTIEAFLFDWRLGASALAVLAALTILGLGTVAAWRREAEIVDLRRF